MSHLQSYSYILPELPFTYFFFPSFHNIGDDAIDVPEFVVKSGTVFACCKAVENLLRKTTPCNKPLVLSHFVNGIGSFAGYAALYVCVPTEKWIVHFKPLFFGYYAYTMGMIMNRQEELGKSFASFYATHHSS